MTDADPHDAARSAGGASDDRWRRLFADLTTGDANALESLYDVAARPVFGIAHWRTGSVEDARDVVQEVFLRIARSHRRLGSVEDPRAWLLSLAHHVSVDVVRRRKRREAGRVDDFPYLAAPDGDVPREIDARRASTFLRVLPDEQREAVWLKHFADCTFAAIGRITGVPTFTAASRYRLGLAKLRRMMGGAP
ncbi:MAG TPA: sigma-70 family RNA polymerase sigma factor [Thermoanaerobaculia bacterium]|nr:sigma-70 family RNA polymerase sigma factor [Thermoanaerobaculia bacterium]HQR66778.1 sigma-70 family RNA polymerase sigma factor [Thermoanaerobaculia bacterium]